jgi:hypothetical protein
MENYAFLNYFDLKNLNLVQSFLKTWVVSTPWVNTDYVDTIQKLLSIKNLVNKNNHKLFFLKKKFWSKFFVYQRKFLLI